MKLAYLMLAHAQPEQIVRSIEALRPTASVFVVHIDRRSPQAVEDAVRRYAEGVGDVLLAPRQACYWGGYGIVRATFACIGRLLDSGVAFEYAALISGQDYPIASAAQVRAFFAARPGTEFIEAFPLRKANRWTEQGGRFQAMARVMNWTFWLRSRPLSVALWRRFYKGWEPYGGSQWWCLSREAVMWLEEYRRANPGIERYFRRTFIPDEAMIQSMMANSPFRERISAEALTYVDWERPNPKYPRTLDEEDVERVMGSGRLWARKVDAVRSEGWMEAVDREMQG